jgi:hypothetical protein
MVPFNNIARSNEILGWEGVGTVNCAFLKCKLIRAC